jgi:hypothetical protein
LLCHLIIEQKQSFLPNVLVVPSLAYLRMLHGSFPNSRFTGHYRSAKGFQVVRLDLQGQSDLNSSHLIQMVYVIFFLFLYK